MYKYIALSYFDLRKYDKPKLNFWDPETIKLTFWDPEKINNSAMNNQ